MRVCPDRGRQRAYHRKDLKDKRHKRAWEKQNITQDMIHRQIKYNKPKTRYKNTNRNYNH